MLSMPERKMVSKSNQAKSENTALTALSIRAIKHNDAKAETATPH